MRGIVPHGLANRWFVWSGVDASFIGISDCSQSGTGFAVGSDKSSRMLSAKTKYSLINAKQYFEEHLCPGDYYSESEHALGQWFGNGAALGLVAQLLYIPWHRMLPNGGAPRSSAP